MASTAVPRHRTKPRSPHTDAPSPGQRSRAAAAIRSVGRRIGHQPVFGCDPCEVAWAGPEADCWGCGRPASDYSRRRASTLQLLLRVTAPAIKAHR
jgi:hypothetical protein